MNWVKILTITCIVPFILLSFTSVSAFEIGAFEEEIEAADPFRNVTCSGNDDCSIMVNGSLCEGGLCACPVEQPIFVNVTALEGYCLESLNLTETNCTFRQQCNYQHSACVDGTCACEDRYIAREDGNCGEMKKNPLVPILVGSAIAGTIIVTLIAYCYMSRKNR